VRQKYDPISTYLERRQSINYLLMQLQNKLDEHYVRFADDSNNWNLVGDLEHIEKRLQELIPE
jgi:hypothetical protein